MLLRNARRGLAKPTAHGRYLAMDLEPIDPQTSDCGRVGLEPGDATRSGRSDLVFERRWAERLAMREEYDPCKFLELIAMADRAGMALGEFLLRNRSARPISTCWLIGPGWPG